MEFFFNYSVNIIKNFLVNLGNLRCNKINVSLKL